MLIVFKREDKSLYGKCKGCTYFVELRDDEKQYPKTVGVICGADQTFMAECFNFDWYRAVSHYHKRIPLAIPEMPRADEMRIVIERLRRIGK